MKGRRRPRIDEDENATSESQTLRKNRWPIHKAELPMRRTRNRTLSSEWNWLRTLPDQLRNDGNTITASPACSKMPSTGHCARPTSPYSRTNPALSSVFPTGRWAVRAPSRISNASPTACWRNCLPARKLSFHRPAPRSWMENLLMKRSPLLLSSICGHLPRLSDAAETRRVLSSESSVWRSLMSYAVRQL